VSYVHCPACSRAFHVVVDRACPRCSATRDPIDEIVAAADQLARAMARATADQLAAAEHRLSPVLAPIRAVLAPPPPPDATGQKALLATVAIALLARAARPVLHAVSARAVIGRMLRIRKQLPL
jgi:hypothetical protein